MNKKFSILLAGCILAGCILSACTNADTSDTTASVTTEATTMAPTETTTVPPTEITTQTEPVTTQVPTTKAPETEPPTEAPVDYMQVYGDVLDNYYSFISSGGSNSELCDSTGVQEYTMSEGDNALNVLGYTLQDLSGDGVPELLIGCVEDGTNILAAYTASYGEPQRIWEAWSRSRRYLLDDGSIYYNGSSGAAYSTAAIYWLSYDATELICQDYYFSYPIDGDYNQVGIYYNTTGEHDTAVSELVATDYTDFNNFSSEASARIVHPYYTPFSQY